MREPQAQLDGFLRREGSWLAAVVLGTLLRGYRLLWQIPVDDEWHALHKVSAAGLRDIATHFGISDYSIPVTLYLELLTRTIGLTELTLRLPFFLTGVAMLVLCPLWIRPFLGRRTADAFAWLLAVSPIMVFYSRFARPYVVTCLLTFLAVALAERWWRESRTRSRRRLAAFYVLATASAGYLNLTVLPFALSPFIYFVVRSAVGAGGGEATRFGAALRRLLPTCLALVALLALLLGPPMVNDPDPIFGKVGGTALDLGAVDRALPLLAGSRVRLVQAALLLLAALGVWRAWRRAPDWSGLMLTAIGAQVAAVVVASPYGVGSANVLARYLLPALPAGLMFVGCGLATLVPRRGGSALVAAVGWVLLLLGPLPGALQATRHWFPNVMLTRLADRGPEIATVPELYERLGNESAGSLTIVEAPWIFSLWDNPLPFYEEHHRQRTRIGFTVGLCRGERSGELPPTPGIRLRGFARLADIAALEEAGVDYVIFHRDPTGELSAPVDTGFVEWIGRQAPDLERCLATFRERWGEPVWDGPELVAFAAPGRPGFS